MTNANDQLRKAMEPIIIDPYMMFYEQAKKLYKDEQAIQSATASMYIRYGNLADRNPNFSTLLKKIEGSINAPKTNDFYIKAYHDAIKFMYAPLIEQNADVGKFIDTLFERYKDDEKTIEEYDDAIADYIARKGVSQTAMIIPRAKIKIKEDRQ